MARVIEAFSDKLTGRIYLAGEEYEGTQERIAVLIKMGYLAGKIVEKPAKKEEENNEEKPKVSSRKKRDSKEL